jgi:hypothetical protein
MPKRRRQKKRALSALAIVRAARAAAKNALDSLREEIRGTTARLQKLIAEERSFKAELFGAARPARRRGGQAPRAAAKPRRRARRKGTPRAERFYQKLGDTFTLEDVRALAGKRAGISLAQWSRAKRIRKTAKGYQKVAA